MTATEIDGACINFMAIGLNIPEQHSNYYRKKISGVQTEDTGKPQRQSI